MLNTVTPPSLMVPFAPRPPANETTSPASTYSIGAIVGVEVGTGVGRWLGAGVGSWLGVDVGDDVDGFGVGVALGTCDTVGRHVLGVGNGVDGCGVGAMEGGVEGRGVPLGSP